MKSVTLVLLGLGISHTDACAHVSDTAQDYSAYLQNNGGSCYGLSAGSLQVYAGRPFDHVSARARRLLPKRPPKSFCAILPPGNAYHCHVPARLEFVLHD
jgi:hypothetical protein